MSPSRWDDADVVDAELTCEACAEPAVVLVNGRCSACNLERRISDEAEFAAHFCPSHRYDCEHQGDCLARLTFRTESSERYCLNHFPWDTVAEYAFAEQIAGATLPEDRPTAADSERRRRRPDGIAYVIGVAVALLAGIFVALVLCWVELRRLDSTVIVRCDPPCTIDADQP